MKKFILAMVLVCGFSAVSEAGPLRNLACRVQQNRPVRTAVHNFVDAKPVRTAVSNVVDARPVRTVVSRTVTVVRSAVSPVSGSCCVTTASAPLPPNTAFATPVRTFLSQCVGNVCNK